MALIDVSQAIANIEGWFSKRSTPTLGQRLNNPGNLVYMGQAGAVPYKSGSYVFAQFSTPEAGWEALNRQVALDASRGLDIQSFIYKYAPPTDNNTESYIKQLTDRLGISRTASLTAAIEPTTAGDVEPTLDAGLTDWLNDTDGSTNLMLAMGLGGTLVLYLIFKS